MEKEKCIPGTIVVVNSKKSKINNELGAKNNGLMCFKNNSNGGYSIGDMQYEIKPGTILELTSTVKKIKTSGVQLKFKIIGSNLEFSSWWCVIKSKINEK